MQGWVKLHRCLTEKPIWLESTPEQKVVLITLLTMANHKGREWEWRGEKYKAEPGQFVTSLKSICDKSGAGISVKNVRTALARFEKYEFLANQSTNRNRLITITNWETYQSKDGEVASKTAGNRQATGKQLATNKNVRREEGKEKDIYRAFDHLSLTKEEYEKLIETHKGKDVDGVLDRIENFAGNKKYKSLYLTANNWLKKEVGISNVTRIPESQKGNKMTKEKREELKKAVAEGRW